MVDLMLPPEAQALLDAISGPESRGLYNIRYGGKKFSDFSDHPRTGKTITSGPNKGRTSTAAGRYQITQTTWDNVIQPALNLPDFSPASQDAAAWYLAQSDYRRRAKSDLLSDLRSGDPATIARIGKKLSGTWTSLPGGIEQGTTTNRFRTAYQQALQTRQVSPEVPPRRPDSIPQGASAVAAIDSLLGNSNPTATAYAPPSGSLQAGLPPAGPPMQTVRPSGPTGSLPPQNRITGGQGSDYGGGPVDLLPRPLQRPAPLVPNIPQISGSGGTDTLRSGPNRDRLVSPRITGGEGTDTLRSGPGLDRLRQPDLRTALAEKYGNVTSPTDWNKLYTQQFGISNRPSPEPRKVQTVAIDPTTGGIAKPDLQTALRRVATQRAATIREKTLSAAATSDPVGGDTLSRDNPLNAAFTANTPDVSRVQADPITQRPPSIPTTMEVARAEQNVQRNRPAVTPKPPSPFPIIDRRDEGVQKYASVKTIPQGPQGRGRPRPPTASTPPVQTAAGEPGQLRVLDETFGPNVKPGVLKPGQQMVPQGVDDALDLERLVAEPRQPLPLTPQEIGGALMADLPQIPRVNPAADAVVLPRRRPPGGPLKKATTLAEMGDIVTLLNSPEAQMVGEVNAGKRPFLGGLMRAFPRMFGITDERPKVATARSTPNQLQQAQAAWLSGSKDTPAPLSVYNGNDNNRTRTDWGYDTGEPNQMIRQADGTFLNINTGKRHKYGSTGSPTI